MIIKVYPKNSRLTLTAEISEEEFNHFVNTPNFIASLLFNSTQLAELKLKEDETNLNRHI